MSHEHSQRHTVEQIVDVPVPQVLVFEHIVKQIVDVPVTIPQERLSERIVEPNRAEFRSLLDTLFPGTSGSSSSAPAHDSAPDSAVLLEKAPQRIKLRQEVETALADCAAQELLQEEELAAIPATKKAKQGKHKH